MKYTPGPWSAGGGNYIPITAVRNGKHCQIGRAESCGSHNLPSSEVEANARLIAAAPDLLEALRECLSCEFAVTDKAAIAKAESAIAKAEGRS